jgi:butyryl-CoA dehydrogenase
VAQGGAALMILQEEVSATCEEATQTGVDASWVSAVREAGEKIVGLTMELGGRGLSGNIDAMMRHSSDYLELFGIYIISWQWLAQASAAKRGILNNNTPREFYEAKLLAAQYWIKTELPKIDTLIQLCQQDENSYTQMRPDWF